MEEKTIGTTRNASEQSPCTESTQEKTSANPK